MERATGVEPATSSVGSWHSTAELRPPASKCRVAAAHCQIDPLIYAPGADAKLAEPSPLAVSVDSEGRTRTDYQFINREKARVRQFCKEKIYQ